MTLEDVRECPATYGLAASWILVFALMHLAQHGQVIPPRVSAQIGPGAIVTTTSHRFGDMTWGEIRQGEAWRALTATFIHYSLIHLGLNLIGLIKLGRLIEPWYGAGPFLALCLAIGAAGNLAGGLLRQGLDLSKAWAAASSLARAWPGLVARLSTGGRVATDQIPSGGGSTILLGLIGLCAVVGWRSRTRIGSYLRDQMVALLAFTGLLGLLLPNLVDNFGHAGGALAGLAAGFFHRPLIRGGERRGFRRLALAGASIVVAGSLTLAARDARVESALSADIQHARARFQLDLQLLQDLERIHILYGRAAGSDPRPGDLARELEAAAEEDLFSRGPWSRAKGRDGQADPAQAAGDRAGLVELVGRLDGIPAGVLATAYGEGVAADLDRVRTLGRLATTSRPRYSEAYDFAVSWTAATRVVAADRVRAQARLIELDRLVAGAR